MFCYVSRALEDVATPSLSKKVVSPYNSTSDYQRFASALAMNTHTPPTTIVSDDGMTIKFRKHTFRVSEWRLGLQKLAKEIDKELADLCMGKDFGFKIPSEIVDDWTNTDRQYSFLGNATFIPDKRALLREMLQQPDQQLAYADGSSLKFRSATIHKFLDKCHTLLLKLALYCFFTAGQTPRAAEFMDHKPSNSARPRTIFWNHGSLWLVTRRTKTEAKTRKESFIPMKCHPHLTEVMLKYLSIIRPVEQELVQVLAGHSAGQLYKEFMWVKAGERMPVSDFYQAVMDFHNGCMKATELGVQAYQQIGVEMVRIFLGSEAQMVEDMDDVIAEQAGHSVVTAQIKYAANVGALPGMSSDLLARFGRASEAWWGVAGFAPGLPPILPLATRIKNLRQSSKGNPVHGGPNQLLDPLTTSSPLPPPDFSSLLQNLQAFMASEVQKFQAEVRTEVRLAVAEGLAVYQVQHHHQQPQVVTRMPTHTVPPTDISHPPSVNMEWDDNRDDMVSLLDFSQDGGDNIQPMNYQPLPWVTSDFELDDDLRACCEGLLYEHYPDVECPQFRSPQQLEAVALAIERKRSFVAVLPTGSGKSLIFTLPPFRETTLRTYVIIPNRSLLDDQLARAAALGLTVDTWSASKKKLKKTARLIFLAMESAVTNAFNE